MGRSLKDESELSQDFYYNHFYFQFPALSSLCDQISAVHAESPANVLEIGKGNGFVSDFLKKAGFNVTTFDINERLEPDVVGSVTELASHFPENSFDLVLCAEVLEHIPFESFEAAISQIARVSKRRVILTLPRAQSFMFSFTPDISIKCFGRGRIFKPSIFFSLPSSRISELHHWEIDSRPETKMKRLKSMIGRYLSVESVTRVRHCPYHYMFALNTLHAVERGRS